MATVVDICNLALSHIGDRATLVSIDPPEGSAQADHCARFWPIARDEALAEFDWRFANHTASLTQYADSVQTNPSWLYAYALPADYLMAREVVYANGTLAMLNPGVVEFEGGTLDAGNRVLFAGAQDLALRYTRRVNDPSRYPPKFVTALSYLLAAYLAGPVVKGRAAVQLATAMRSAWTKLVSEAATTDANQTHTRINHHPAGLKARGYGTGTEIIEQGQYRHELPFWAA